jgi:hypothetical protein
MLPAHRWPVVLIAVVSLASMVPLGRAQAPAITEPLPAPPLTKERIDNPPARELKVEQLSEPLKRPLNRPQPALVEQKYVAIVQLQLPVVERDYSSIVHSSHRLYDLQRLGNTFLLAPSGGSFNDEPLSTQLSRLMEEIPEDAVPKADQDFFRSAEVDIGFVKLSNNVSGRFSSTRDANAASKPFQQFQILGKTAQECEQRSRALLTILDHGFSRPLQLELLARRSEQAEVFAKRQEDYLRTKDTIPALQKSLEEYSDLSNDMQTGLRLQQREAEIKIAGTKARLAACEKLLTQKDHPPERARLIENSKTAAEIELADLEAQHAKAIELVAKVNARIGLSAQLEQASKSVPDMANSLNNRLQTLLRIDRDILRHAPLPLVEAKIVIRPVEWTSP